MMSTITETEQKIRERLASCHHIIRYYGWDDLLAAHVSARIPGTGYILITPHNMAFEKVTPANLVKCDLAASMVTENDMGLMPQAKNIHFAIYQARPDVMCAIHTHSQAGVAVSSLKSGLLFINQQSLRFYNDVAYHDYGGLALDNEGEAIVASLQDKTVMILRNHGLLVTGDSVAHAMYLAYYLEVCCEIQLKTLATGQGLAELDPQVCQLTYTQFKKIQSVTLDFQELVERAKLS